MQYDYGVMSEKPHRGITPTRPSGFGLGRLEAVILTWSRGSFSLVLDVEDVRSIQRKTWTPDTFERMALRTLNRCFGLLFCLLLGSR